MPTTTKTLTFSAGFFTSCGAFVVLCVTLGTAGWVTSTIAVSDNFSNGSIVITYGLFHGQSTQQLTHGLGESDKGFEGKRETDPSGEREAELPPVTRYFSASFLVSVFLFCSFN